MNENPQTVTIETPEHIEIEFQLAGIGTRAAAYLVDRLVQLGMVVTLVLVVVLLLWLAGWAVTLADLLENLWKAVREWIIAIAIVCYGIITIGYFILFEYLWGGATPGKRSQGIRVIRRDGRALSFLDAAVRNILRFVDIIGDAYPLGLVVMFIDSRNRRLGDIAAGTLVVREKQANQLVVPRAAGELTGLETELRQVVDRMTTEDYQLVKKFLARREIIDVLHREALADEIFSRIVGSAESGLSKSDPEVVLEAVAATYRERMRIL